MNIFLEDDYKKILRHRLDERKTQLGKRYSSEALAEHCDVQKSYLSRVFNGDAHLNQDQLFLASDFLGFGAEESRYLDLLQQRERASVGPRIKKLERDIAGLRREHLNPDKRVAAERLKEVTEAQTVYYLDPFCQLVHMFLTVDTFAQSLARVRKALGISTADMDRIINVLQKLGIVRFDEDRWVVEKAALTLPRESALSKACNLLVRQQALERSKHVSEGNMTRYNVFFTADEAAYKALSTEFLAFLERAQKIVKPAKAEKVYQLTFDLIPWTEDEK